MYFVCQVTLLIFLAINAYTDIKTKKISILASGVFFIAGVVLSFFSKEHTILSIIGGLCVGAVLLIMGKLTKQAMGSGDGMIFLVTGVYLGFINNIALLLYGLVICAIVSIIFLVFRKYNLKDKIPFAPFILTSFIIMLLTGV